MTNSYVAPILSAALKKLKEIIAENEEKGVRTVVFCEDRLSLAAERAVCDAVGGTFSVSVFTLSRFLASEKGKADNVLSSQGSAMALRRIIDDNRGKLTLFKRLSSASAAQEVYDTIALLYASKISAEDLGNITPKDDLLGRKIHDIALLYSEYSKYLKDNGAVDRNAYLRALPEAVSSSEKVRGATVIFLGFQAFTSSVADCVRACMRTADVVSGLFIGGRESVYVNEAWTTFLSLAKECGTCGVKCPISDINAVTRFLPSGLNAAAEALRRGIFEPECFSRSPETEIKDGEVSLISARDENEEISFVAAHIIKCITAGVRYRSISVMLPDMGLYLPIIERTFGEYGIPYYADTRYSLLSHPVCAFILSFLNCVCDGCRCESVIEATSSPMFVIEGKDINALSRGKDMFENYLLRYASFRGGVFKDPDFSICEGEDIEGESVELIRKTFCNAYSSFPKGARTKYESQSYIEAIRSLLKTFSTESRLEELASDEALSDYPSVAAMTGRAFSQVCKVLDEAEKLTAGDKFTAREFYRILKSGFAAAEVSLIPPKRDAVFVGDLAATVNTGSFAVFVVGLTDSVPAASLDTAVLTDGELAALEKLRLAVSPKIAQVNRRVRETTALNLCAFSNRLYLTFPASSNGEENGKSEIIDYVSHLFSVRGKPLSPVSAADIAGAIENLPYYCARPLPALRKIAAYAGGGDGDGKAVAALYKALEDDAYRGGEWKECFRLAESLQNDDDKVKRLDPDVDIYGDYVSPTTLETYFACPYKAFMRQGLRLVEREEGGMRPIDSGVFVHSVLEEVAPKLNSFKSEEECAAFTRTVAEEKLSAPKFRALSADKRGQYAAEALLEETVAVSLGAYRQIKYSLFSVHGAEEACDMRLIGGTRIYGRCDRVDYCGDMVRVIDYKTGAMDDTPQSYFAGLKLQLPLYLSAFSQYRRAVGAYYFPANTAFSEKKDGDFCLKGFMDGSEEVVRNSDITIADKQKSAYVNAYLNGRKVDKAMTRDDFADFLGYAALIADQGGGEMKAGNIAPSPSEATCAGCKFIGSCGYDCRTQGERIIPNVSCKQIARIYRIATGKEDENGGEGDE